jgi:uncharacterized protein YxjI
MAITRRMDSYTTGAASSEQNMAGSRIGGNVSERDYTRLDDSELMATIADCWIQLAVNNDTYHALVEEAKRRDLWPFPKDS